MYPVNTPSSEAVLARHDQLGQLELSEWSPEAIAKQARWRDQWSKAKVVTKLKKWRSGTQESGWPLPYFVTGTAARSETAYDGPFSPSMERAAQGTRSVAVSRHHLRGEAIRQPFAGPRKLILDLDQSDQSRKLVGKNRGCARRPSQTWTKAREKVPPALHGKAVQPQMGKRRQLLAPARREDKTRPRAIILSRPGCFT